ncbi:HAMP domain-containing sensor histidine kinase [Chryseobacterium sp.]|uniref:sensor histidine kinase n=1 Tax=Chryseobacterium sp. TaxID=1871047 RepID=UPI0025C3FAA6|nr:HAMP domain-containing sensor histidine kinase [Chryseobacterium sp.]MBV8325163.1 HAMP domain-containing histidine kinase [Chryseobacterium sp.]
MDNGFPQSSAKSIIKDKYGFIWISTESAILRYDGTSLQTFSDFKLNNLHFGEFMGNPLMDSITVHNDYDENRIMIKGRTLQQVPLNKQDRGMQTENGELIHRITKNTFTTSIFYRDLPYFIQLKDTKYKFKEKESVLYTDEQGRDIKIRLPFVNNDLHNIFMDKEVLFINDPKKRTTYAIDKGKLSKISGKSLLNDPESKIYWQQVTNQTFIIHHRDIYVVEMKGETPVLRFLVHYDQVSKYPFAALFYDKSFNRLYLGTLNNGLNILQLSAFYVARKETDFANNVYYASLPFTRSTIITTDGTEFGRKGIVKNHLMGQNDPYMIAYDQAHNMLVRDDKKIFRFYKNSDYKKKDSFSIKQGLKAFIKDENFYGLSFFNFDQNQLYLYQEDIFAKPAHVYNFNSLITDFHQYDDHKFLIGGSDGLFVLDEKKNTIRSVMKNIRVKNFVHTADHQLWITTNKSGFYLFRNGKVIKMPYDKGKNLQLAHFIFADRKGFYWISSNNGLFKVSRKQLLQYADHPKTPVFYYRFTKKDGLLTNEFNGVPSHELENGDLVFPSMDGFLFFNPDEVKTYYPDHTEIYIERAQVGHSAIQYFKESLTLASDYKVANVYLDIPYFSDAENLYLEARLSGDKNTEWQQVDTEKELKYAISDLGPGNYHLHVRMLISADGKFKEKTIALKIIPFFYQTLLFKIGVLIIGLIIIIFIVRLATNYLRVRNNALKEIVKSKNSRLKENSLNIELLKTDLKNEAEYQKKLVETISHDITTPIRFIAMLSHKLHESDDIELQKKYFDSIYKSSEQLYEFTLSLKEYAELYKAKNIFEENEYSINKILKTKKKLFLEIAHEKGTLITRIERGNVYTRINQPILSSIIHNIIDNAVKNTYDGEIILDSTENEHNIVITISDTGSGMTSEQIALYTDLFNHSTNEIRDFKGKGIGLHMVIHLIKKIDATIRFRKNSPKGTIVEIILNKN